MYACCNRTKVDTSFDYFFSHLLSWQQ
ncbi:hypothetical protein SBA7_380003 [Candidatus Sulfotelmatobacter sp. SbA7]|nr:hypothetical protein SBA7_380003 [Candidatus Sulfotelmatobacter sp. SbA7]